jgi:hypothetical protein
MDWLQWQDKNVYRNFWLSIEILNKLPKDRCCLARSSVLDEYSKLLSHGLCLFLIINLKAKFHSPSLRISNKYGSVTAFKQWPNKHLCPRRPSFKWSLPSLVRIFSWNKTSISYVNSSIKLNFYQSANVKLKPRKRCVFWIYVMLFQSSDTFHNEFVPS